MGGASKGERSFQAEEAACTWDKSKHGLFEKLSNVLNGQMVQKQGGTHKGWDWEIINSEPTRPGKDSKLSTCKEKALESFQFGSFGCNKEMCLVRGR